MFQEARCVFVWLAMLTLYALAGVMPPSTSIHGSAFCEHWSLTMKARIEFCMLVAASSRGIMTMLAGYNNCQLDARSCS